MAGEQITINSRKYDQSLRRSWTCELLQQSDNLLVFVGVFDADIKHPGLGSIRRGTISYEYYWLERWYNAFRFHEPDGTFRNYYCNINMPPVFERGVLEYVDLDIDVVVWPDGRCEILDEIEYSENAVKFGYTDAVRANVSAALAELLRMAENNELPGPS